MSSVNIVAAEAQKALSAGKALQVCFRKMQTYTANPKIKAVLQDLLLMEEMNEFLLRSLRSEMQGKS